MRKISNIKQAISESEKLKKENKKLVLVGGCFDILHIGHIKFLNEAKKLGDKLFLILESDQNVSRLKGKDRPINSQKDRAQILSSISYVDCVVLLNEIKNNDDYDKIVTKLNPDIIAITKGSGQEIHAKRQAKKINAKVISVMRRIEDKSTTNLAKFILKNID